MDGLTKLPDELLGCIFGYVAEPRLLFPFLSFPIFYSSAVEALYKDLAVKLCTRDGQVKRHTNYCLGEAR